MASTILIAAALIISHVTAAPPVFSWDTLPLFVHCSNKSGPLNNEIVSVMATQASFSVIEKYQCLECAPNFTGGEDKVIAAAAAIRAVNPNAAVFLYFAVDYARTWYTLGTWFDAHPDLEVHNANGSLAIVPSGDDGSWDWHVFDFGQAPARAAWVLDIAQTVWTPAPDGQRLFDGIFIDGYRGNASWTNQLIPGANASTQAAWLAGVTVMGPALAEALPALPGDAFVRLINPGAELGSYPGYNANSIEFFAPTAGSIAALNASALAGVFTEVHAYIGDNLGLFNLTIAAYLVAAGNGTYFGAGNTWDTCESWLIPHSEYSEPLGPPDAPAALNGTTWTRSFGGGATTVTFDLGDSVTCAPNEAGAWVIGNTAQFFTLVSSTPSERVYNVSCTTACSTSWHSAVATMSAPFTGLHIAFNMQPGFKPVQQDGTFDETCTVISYGGTVSGDWCAKTKNPSCTAVPTTSSCIRWASGNVTGNAC